MFWIVFFKFKSLNFILLFLKQYRSVFKGKFSGKLFKCLGTFLQQHIHPQAASSVSEK